MDADGNAETRLTRNPTLDEDPDWQPLAPSRPGGGGSTGGAPGGVRQRLDRDGDGVESPRDCDDTNPRVRPGAAEVPGNRIDEDCDGRAARLRRIRSSVVLRVTFSPQGSPTSYVRLARLVVRDVPAGASVEIVCRGPGCRFRSRTRRVRRATRVVALHRHFRRGRLRDGAVIEVRVKKRQTIGKVARYRVRSGRRIPSIRTLCLQPGAKRPTRCRSAARSAVDLRTDGRS
jgi:hypothetical protein